MSELVVIDAMVYYQTASQLDLYPYLSSGSRAYFGDARNLAGGHGIAPLIPPHAYEPPGGLWRSGSSKLGEQPPGSDLETLRIKHLDPVGIERAVLSFGPAATAMTIPNSRFSVELARAINDWTRESWLEQDSRLYGLAVTPSQVPEEAAAEIRRCAAYGRMVGILLSGNGLGRPFGHPAYGPIFEAAAEASLPVVITSDGDSPPNTTSQPTAGGLPLTFFEYYSLRSQSLVTHLASLVVQGVLTRYPNLRVVLAGAGFSWVTPWLWRLDPGARSYAASEAPWLRQKPSEQFVEQVRVLTHSERSLDAPALAAAIRGNEDAVCFASGFPRWDGDSVDGLKSKIAPSLAPKIFGGTAMGTYRW
jgi:uncharacterized protein